jgi:mRNA interferase MazF
VVTSAHAVPRRGDVIWAALPAPRGSEAGFRRPVVVVQADAFNRSRIATVIVAPLTTNLALAAAPGNVRVSARGAGLAKPSVVNVSLVRAIDRALLGALAGRLRSDLMARVDDGLRVVLGLAPG